MVGDWGADYVICYDASHVFDVCRMSWFWETLVLSSHEVLCTYVMDTT